MRMIPRILASAVVCCFLYPFNDSVAADVDRLFHQAAAASGGAYYALVGEMLKQPQDDVLTYLRGIRQRPEATREERLLAGVWESRVQHREEHAKLMAYSVYTDPRAPGKPDGLAGGMLSRERTALLAERILALHGEMLVPEWSWKARDPSGRLLGFPLPVFYGELEAARSFFELIQRPLLLNETCRQATVLLLEIRLQASRGAEDGEFPACRLARHRSASSLPVILDWFRRSMQAGDDGILLGDFFLIPILAGKGDLPLLHTFYENTILAFPPPPGAKKDGRYKEVKESWLNFFAFLEKGEAWRERDGLANLARYHGAVSQKDIDSGDWYKEAWRQKPPSSDLSRLWQ